MADIFNMSDTWDNVATTFTAIKMNVNDVGSAADSLMQDWQRNGISVGRIGKLGTISMQSAGSATAPTFHIASAGTGNAMGLFASGFGLALSSQGACVALAGLNTFRVGASGSIGWSPSVFNPDTNTADTMLFRDGAAGIMAQRNGTNGQLFRIYGTYTDAPNFRRAVFGTFNGVDFDIQTEGAGTGAAAGSLNFGTVGTRRLSITAAGPIINTSSSPFSNPFISNELQWNGFGSLSFTADGLATIRGWGASFGLLRLGGTTSSFPALKRSATVLQARLADDSDFAPLQGRIRSHANATAETPVATHTLRYFDAAGTEYKVLAVAA